MIQTLAVIGVGLIGGSLALALRKEGVVGKVIGAGRSEDNLKLAQSLGIVDSWTTSLSDAVKGADMVVVAVPMGAYKAVFQAIAPALEEEAIVTDVGSTKQHAVDLANRHLPRPQYFVPAHPIAGTEKSGADAAFSTLYQNHLCILTPEEGTSAHALRVVGGMWQQVGARVVSMQASVHDTLLAAVSHLPHLAAFALVNAVNKQKTDDFDPMAYAAGGFRDFTRIASSSPDMWRDIALANRDALVQQIDILMDELHIIKLALQAQDKDRLGALFMSAKQARDTWLATHGKED